MTPATEVIKLIPSATLSMKAPCHVSLLRFLILIWMGMLACPAIQADPVYDLAVVDARGKESTAFTAGHKGRLLFVRSTRSGKKVWSREVGGTRPHDLSMHLSRDGQSALLIHYYGVKSQSLYWLSLVEGESGAAEIPLEGFEKLIASTCSVDEASIIDTFFDMVKWDDSGRCHLKWTSDVKLPDTYVHHTGIVTVSREGTEAPKLTMGRFLIDVPIEKMKFVKYLELLDKE